MTWDTSVDEESRTSRVLLREKAEMPSLGFAWVVE